MKTARFPSHHAVSRWQDRISPRASYDQAKREILMAFDQAVYEKSLRTGERLFRRGELRFVVKQKTIVTIEEICDGLRF